MAIPDTTKDFGDGTNDHANIERAGTRDACDGVFGNAAGVIQEKRVSMGIIPVAGTGDTHVAFVLRRSSRISRSRRRYSVSLSVFTPLGVEINRR